MDSQERSTESFSARPPRECRSCRVHPSRTSFGASSAVSSRCRVIFPPLGASGRALGRDAPSPREDEGTASSVTSSANARSTTARSGSVRSTGIFPFRLSRASFSATSRRRSGTLSGRLRTLSGRRSGNLLGRLRHASGRFFHASRSRYRFCIDWGVLFQCFFGGCSIVLQIFFRSFFVLLF